MLQHVPLRVDGRAIVGSAVFVGQQEADDAVGDEPGATPLVSYRLTYPLAAAPHEVEIGQDFLREYPRWNAPCVLRLRRFDQANFESSLLVRGQTVKFVCTWSPNAAPQSADSIHTDIEAWPLFRAYALHGIEHILTGYDHLLFISALVLAARSFWDLVKVVTAFTLAHTLTLTLSVCNVVTLSSAIVEPMIAASIIFVAVQNIFWPERSSGWGRLAIAFGFGLFHGLGFAGGLKDAMSEMPSIALWLALIAFSLGVEIGHQTVVIPLYSLLAALRKFGGDRLRAVPQGRILKFGSAGIALAGIYFFIAAIR